MTPAATRRARSTAKTFCARPTHAAASRSPCCGRRRCTGPYNTLPEREFSYFARALRGRSIVIPGDPSALVQFAHVDDLAAAFLAAALTDRGVGNCYTVCGEYSASVDYWIRAVGRAVDQARRRGLRARRQVRRS